MATCAHNMSGTAWRSLPAHQRWLVVTLVAYFWASAFGALTLPGTSVSYANITFVLLLTAISGPRPREHWLMALGLFVLMAQDMIFRNFTNEWYGLGYSLNIGRLACFVLLVQQFQNLPPSVRTATLISFGVAAFASEIFVIYEPSYRLALFNARSIGEGFGFEIYRPTGLIGDPNYFAVPLALMAVAAFQAKRYRWFVFACFLVLASGSRSAMIAVLLPVLLLQLSRAKERGLAVALIVITYIGIVLLAVGLNSLLREGTTSESDAERMGLLWQGLENIASFSYLTTTYGMPSGLGLDGDKLVVHNTYIQTLSTSLVLGLFLLYRTVRGLWRPTISPILLCIVIEMQFLDMSANSSFLLVFLLYSIPTSHLSIHAAPSRQPV